MTATTTSYFTFREASEITGLNEATIRRLSKKPESKPYVRMKQGKKGSVYTIQADYLFGIYPRLKFDKNPIYVRVGTEQLSTTSVANEEAITLLAAKDELIHYWMNEAIYLRNENLTLQKQIHELRSRVDNHNTIQWSKKVIHWATGFWHSVVGAKRTEAFDEVG